MNKVFSCPSCGAEIHFKSLFSFYNTCSYCQTLVVKHGTDLENLGKASVFPKDVSPLQIGVTGYYKKEKFEIVGRQRVAYERGFWNEWCVCFGSGDEGWLADAQGFYLFSTELLNKSYQLPTEEFIKPGTIIKFNNIPFTVDDIKTVTATHFYGELPYFNLKNPKRKSIDLSNEKNFFANIEFIEEREKIFIGEYLEFDDFHFENLKEIEGWTC